MHMLTSMLIVTTDGLPGYEIHEVLGEALGVAQRAAGRGGGSSTEFHVPEAGSANGPGLLDTRRAAIAQLTQDAQRRGANAVVGLAFDTVDIAGRSIEVCAYGTAVVARPAGQASRQAGTRSAPAPASEGAGVHYAGAYSARQPGPAMVGRDVTISGQRPTAERPPDYRDPGREPSGRDTSDHVRQIPRGDRPGNTGDRPAPGMRDVTLGGADRRTGRRPDHPQRPD